MSQGTIDALQTALAAEHAAVFVYGALGGQTSRTANPGLYAEVTGAYVAHQRRRDELVAFLGRAGADPVPAEPGYALPPDLSTPVAISGRALRLEQACAATYAFVVGSSADGHRRWAVDALLDAAVRAIAFGGRPQDLPGL